MIFFTNFLAPALEQVLQFLEPPVHSLLGPTEMQIQTIHSPLGSLVSVLHGLHIEQKGEVRLVAGLRGVSLLNTWEVGLP